MTSVNSTVVDAQSPSIQAHLSILQGVIQRMGANSAASKGWCVTLVAAVLVIVADKAKPQYAWLALLPTFAFALLDAHYLALERGFRNSYNDFVAKLHSNTLNIQDLYLIEPRGEVVRLQLSALGSLSVCGFYLPLALLIAIAKSVVIQ